MGESRTVSVQSDSIHRGPPCVEPLVCYHNQSIPTSTLGCPSFSHYQEYASRIYTISSKNEITDICADRKAPHSSVSEWGFQTFSYGRGPGTGHKSANRKHSCDHEAPHCLGGFRSSRYKQSSLFTGPNAYRPRHPRYHASNRDRDDLGPMNFPKIRLANPVRATVNYTATAFFSFSFA